jgi:hypothetical protein
MQKIYAESEINNLFCRYYKNSVSQEEGWNEEVISWCQKEAKQQNLGPEEYWGGLILDEMKIPVHTCILIRG